MYFLLSLLGKNMFENDHFEKKAMDKSQHQPTLSHDNKND